MQAYCMTCRDYSRVGEKETVQKRLVGGREVTYSRYDGYCLTCGEELFHPDIHDKNMVKVEKVLDQLYGNIGKGGTTT